MSPLVRILVPLVASVLLLAEPGAAAAQEGPTGTTPTETSPPPEDLAPPVEPVVTLDGPTESGVTTIVIHVPPEPRPKRAAARPPAAPPLRKSHTRAAPTVSRDVAAPSPSRPLTVTPAPAKATKASRHTKPSRPKRASPARVSHPVVIRDPDRMPAAGVLGARFSSSSVAPPAPARTIMFWVAMAHAAALAMLLALAGMAPSLVPLWPRVFVRVIRAREQLLLAAACVACGAITVAITWAVSGPGA